MSRRATGDQKKLGGDYFVGNRHQLVALVSFEDCSFTDDEAATLSKWNDIFNKEHFQDDPFVGSVHDYFYAQSYGQFNLTFDLQYVHLQESLSKYASTKADDENSQFLVQDVVAALSERNIDWGQYDWNSNGFVNQLLIVFAGKGSGYGGFGGGTNTIWPHQWWLSDHIDPVTSDYCDPVTVVSGGSYYLVDSYCAVQELASNGTYASFGTICHEFTHCFGFPDFYYGSTQYVGEWDLMDYGNYNGGGFCPTGYSAHERWLMGWLQPVELTTSTTVTGMQALCNEPQAYIICNDGHPDEYYMVENRQQEGWDVLLPGSGIVVFHVDFDETIWLTDYPNGESTDHYTIIPANNSTYYSSNKAKNWPYPYGTNDKLTNDSKPAAVLLHPNTDGTLLMNKSLLDMKVEDGLASFRFDVSTSSVMPQQKVEGTPKELYRIGPVSIQRYPDGETRKVLSK